MAVWPSRHGSDRSFFFVIDPSRSEDVEVLELLFLLDGDAGFVVRRVCQHGFGKVTVGCETIIPTVPGKNTRSI